MNYKTMSVLSVASVALLTIALIPKQNVFSATGFANNNYYHCDDIVFGEEVVSTGSTKDITGPYYTITNFVNAKHTDDKALIVGGTQTDKRSGGFDIVLDNVTCSRAIVYACGFLGDSDSKNTLCLAINDNEQIIHKTGKNEPYEFKPYTFENINSDTLHFRNSLENLQRRICISKIVFRLTN